MSDGTAAGNRKPAAANNSLAARYCSLALHNAKQRDLSSAVVYARRSLILDPDNEKARRLLGLCLFETGELDGVAAAFRDSTGPDDGRYTEQSTLQVAGHSSEQEKTIAQEHKALPGTLARVCELRARKKWRKAEALLRACKHQSVRVLLIRGCLMASAGKYKAAARLFAAALSKDKGNRAAMVYLRVCCGNPRF